MKLHETIQRVYDKIVKLCCVEVLSNEGWQSVTSLNVGSAERTVVIETDAGHKLECTEDHILIAGDGSEVFAKDSLGREVQTNSGMVAKVVSVICSNTRKRIYDLSLADGTSHTFFANGLLSHNCVILDEFAFLPKNIADKLFTSIYPTISSSKAGKIVIVSTPNGTDNLYYDIWQKANAKNQSKNLDGWKPFAMYWWQVPGHDQAWKEKQIAAIGETRFAQEFNNEFIASSASRKLVPEDVLDKMREEFASLRAFQPKFLAGREEKIVSADDKKTFKFKMWREFNPEKTYLASGDVAEGNGGDSSVLYVWDVSDMAAIEMVAAFSSDSTTISEFAYLSRKILKLYGDPFYICERNGVGAGYIDLLNVTHGYQNFVLEGKNNQPGVYSHIGVKSKACLWTRDMASSDCFKFKIYDRELIDELGTFVKRDTKAAFVSYAALPGSHDDHVMPFVWMCYVLCQELVENYFIVCQTQKSVLGNLYPKRLKPLSDYHPEVVKKISSDPAYQDFLDFKESVAAETSKLLDAEARERDQFAEAIVKPVVDVYFGDDPSWDDWGVANLPRDKQAVDLNPNNRRPSFFVF